MGWQSCNVIELVEVTGMAMSVRGSVLGVFVMCVRVCARYWWFLTQLDLGQGSNGPFLLSRGYG